MIKVPKPRLHPVQKSLQINEYTRSNEPANIKNYVVDITSTLLSHCYVTTSFQNMQVIWDQLSKIANIGIFNFWPLTWTKTLPNHFNFVEEVLSFS